MATQGETAEGIKVLIPNSSWSLLARPRIFLKLAERVLPITLILTVLLFAMGLYMALVASPPDYQQGEAVRIMYVHVPASWLALMIYAFIAVMSLFVLVWRHPLAELFAVSAAPLGTLFTFLSLTTGSLWGKPIWGTFWVWDARLTSVFCLLLIYGGYWVLYKMTGIRTASLFSLIGALNLPIIKGSVDWWNTLHQTASISKFSAPSLHPTMLTPLLLMTGAYLLYFVSALILRVQTELKQRKVDGAQRRRALNFKRQPA